MSTTTHRVFGPHAAYCPEDGGKWELNCEHYDEAGEVTHCAVLQDTNKRRLAAWKRETASWCEACHDTLKAATA